MDGESKQLMGDCFLRTIVNPRSTNAPIEPPPTKAPVKVELQILRLKEDSKSMIMDTLRAIHGDSFQLGDISKYEDKGGRMKKAYWQDRGNLIVQGGCDFSHVKKTGDSNEDKFRLFALIKLGSYGFAKGHCEEALDHCKGAIDDALGLLFEKYFPPPFDLERTEFDYGEEELEQMRSDEKEALESIYDKLFIEKERNRVWQLKFKIDHLMIHSPSEVRKMEQRRKQEEEEERMKRQTAAKSKKKSKKEPCWNFAKGKCRYGNKCYYSHGSDSEGDETASKGKREKQEEDPNWFFLEIRFPKKSKYPYEAPLLFLKTTCADIPHQLLLRVTRILVQESIKSTQIGMPCIYSIAELLQNDEEIARFVELDRYQFPDPKRSLFYEPEVDSMNNLKIEDLPSHNLMGVTNRSSGPKTNPQQLLKDDLNIIRKFMDKQNNDAYKEMLRHRKQLPAWCKMTDIITAMESHPVLVISGETGCGKSTQVPQFILDNWLFQSSKCEGKVPHVEIICTQPRRLSAIGVAERVAEERVERIGNTIGYQIRLENKISPSTRLTFCTTGILLRRLQSEPTLANVTHIIVDEVHERSEESDFLLLILKQLLEKRPDLKVILMSATLNSNLFSSYFGDVPVLDIPGRTFPVEQLFLEDILEKSGFVLEPDSHFCRKLRKGEEEQLMQELEYADVRAANAAPAKTIKDENLKMADMFARYSDYSKTTCRTLYLLDPLRINPELIEHVLRYIVEGTDHGWPQEGTILIFLPGLAEIQTIHEALTESKLFGPREGKFILVPLHSTLTNEEQALVFKKAPKGKRKIVLSTNIAETSVTIDDCVFVIDCGQMKEKRFDSNRNMESLEVVWVSRANALQRKGRAGRVMPGVSIHLYTRPRFTNHILGQPVPEIHRIPLEPLLLRIKTLDTLRGKSLKDVLMNTIEPPSEENIEAAKKRLVDVGAFDLEEELTALGHHLAMLPVDVRIGKLMLFGAIFQCLDSVLTIAACLSFKSPFVSPFSKRDEAEARKRLFGVANSDHLTMLNAYRKWKETTKRSRYAAHCYAEENYLSSKTLHTIGEMKHQFMELLVSIGFVPVDLSGRRGKFVKDELLELTGSEINANGENNRLLAAILCAALYPNVIKVLTPEKSFISGAGGAVPKLPQASDLRFKTQQDGYVFLHPSSINSRFGHFNSPYLVYQEKVKTSRIYIRETTMVPMLPMVLFSGSDMRIELHGGDFVILLEDGWIALQAETHQVAEMVKFLRLELAKMLELKISDPLLNLLNHEQGRKVIDTIIHLINKE
ncbi:putative ATP-dependent RNA helicase DHX57 [Toxorhynchites rutilus septentrionalis]|uniref:putative ATP-dependent RNA helicase DHX57 n=1 Tax=Toxorhynchites rutilus septentrionalis TaxID=329112 RepID=UPI00247964BA|nr:putative ATP-dependent RNA helicase DHX57 [Toxorhynchites rutilus septentrionalis]